MRTGLTLSRSESTFKKASNAQSNGASRVETYAGLWEGIETHIRTLVVVFEREPDQGLVGAQLLLDLAKYRDRIVARRWAEGQKSREQDKSHAHCQHISKSYIVTKSSNNSRPMAAQKCICEKLRNSQIFYIE